MKKCLYCVLIATICLCFIVPAFADTIVGTNGDYSSILEALLNTTDDIIIQPGIYDIIQEYQNHYGADIFQKMAYRSTEYNFFQAGLYVTERKLTFLPGAVVKCDYPEDQLADDKRFSAFATGENFTIEGLVLYGNNLYYAIHDDYGLHDTYVNQFKNCYISATNCINANIIGGGCGTNSVTVIDNCYFNNHANGTTLRYHNTNKDGATPIVIIKNTYANYSMEFRWYGSQTTKMTGIVIRSYAPMGIFKQIEDPTLNTEDNIDLLIQ